MTDFDFNLEMSGYFYSRAKLIASNGVPKLSDAKANLGSTLAEVVYVQCEEALKEDFGLKEPLKGPGNILWVSPSDLLIGKVALKPPFTPKCLQALTHKGILEIGESLEERFRQEMEVDKQKTLEKYKSELLATIEDRMKVEIKDVEIRERLNCHMEMEKKQLEFEIILKEELNSLEKTVRAQYDNMLTENENSLKEQWMQKMQEETEKTVSEMTKSFLLQLDEQQEKLTHAFQFELRKREILREFDAKLHRKKLTEALRQLKHNLECTNLVNMMYILCTERRKCCESKIQIETFYEKEICKLQNQIKNNYMEISALKKEIQSQMKQIQIRETCLSEVIRHFQKFINFALKAAPTQAEFLLSVEKMMAFELADCVAKSEFIGEQDEPFIIPWSHEGKTRTSTVVSNLEITDYHNCFNELNPPVPEDGSELGEDATLPAIYFKNKMYIREDFRDMLSVGIDIRPSNEIWSKDVELLISNWRKQSNEADHLDIIEEEYSSEDSIEDMSVTEDKDTVSYTNERRRSKQSTVQFIDHEQIEVRRRSGESKKMSRKSSLRPNSISLAEADETEPVTVSNSNLLATKDSIELVVEQKVKSGMLLENPTEDNMENFSYQSEQVKVPDVNLDSTENIKLALETRDSVILRMSTLLKHPSSAEFTSSPRDSIEVAKCILENTLEIKHKPSKLTSARNSIEILRESISKLKEPASICQKKEQPQYHLGQIFGFAGTCCERCKRKEGSLNVPSEIEETGYDSSKILKPDSFSDEKSVKISRIQIINLDEHLTAPSVVSFHEGPQIYASSNSRENVGNYSPPKPKIKRQKKTTRKLKSKYHEIKISGDQEAKEGEQSNDEFTAGRIHSLINLMKDQPHLIQLFTAGSN